MSENKSINFAFRIDDQTLNRLKTSIREITADLAKLVQTANGLNLGGGRNVAMGGGGSFSAQGVTTAVKTQSQQSPQGGGLAQVFLDSSAAMKNMATVSKDSLRIMSDSVRRGIDEQKRSISSLDGDLVKLARRYDELADYKSKALGQGMDPGRAQNSMDVVGKNVVTTEGQRQQQMQQLGQLQAQQAQIAAAQGGGAGAGSGGFMSRIPGFLPGGGYGLSGVAAAMAVANFGLNESRAGTRHFASQEARRADIAANPMQALRGGDYRQMYALRTLDASSREDLRNQTSGAGAWLEQARGTAGQAIGSVPIIGSLGRKLGLVGPDQGGGIFGGANSGVWDSNMAQNAMKQAEEKQKAQLMEGLAMQGFQQSLGSRISARRLMGLNGLHQDPKTGLYNDSYGQLQNRLSARGYDVGELSGAYVGLRAGAGERFAGANADSAMAANAEGLGGFSELLSAGARAGGGNRFAFGAVGGGIDRSAGVQLGSAIIGSGFDVRGTTSGLGMLEAAQAGMGFSGDVGDFRKVQQLQAGIGLGNQVVGGGLDPYQQGRNLVSAIGIRGGSDVYGQDYLANGMNVRQMTDAIRGGELTATAKALGISSGEIRQQMGASISSVLDERLPGVDAGTPMGKALKKYQESGKDLPAYLSGLKGTDREDAVQNLGAAYGLATGEGEEASIGLLGAEAGLDAKTSLRLGKVGRGLTGVEAEDAKARSEMGKQITAELERIGKTFTDVIRGSPQDFTTMKNFGSDMSREADRFISALTRMTDAMEQKFPGPSRVKAEAPTPSRPMAPGERAHP